jgi:hypothetical protein
MPKYHPLYEVLRPDEVAECVEGISDEIYQKLWLFVPLYKGPPPEVAEEPTPGTDSLSKFWNKLSVLEQAALNIAAFKHERQYR